MKKIFLSLFLLGLAMFAFQKSASAQHCDNICSSSYDSNSYYLAYIIGPDAIYSHGTYYYSLSYLPIGWSTSVSVSSDRGDVSYSVIDPAFISVTFSSRGMHWIYFDVYDENGNFILIVPMEVVVYGSV